MQAVIVNTLGEKLKKKDMFYRAFLPEQVNWLESTLPDIGACKDTVVHICAQQTTRQDYHLVILASLEPFPKYMHEEGRNALSKILNAYVLSELVKPLLDADCVPAGVELILTYHSGERDSGIGEKYVYSLYLKPDGRPLKAYTMDLGDEKKLRIPITLITDEEPVEDADQPQPSKPKPKPIIVEGPDPDDLDISSPASRKAAAEKQKAEDEKNAAVFIESQIQKTIASLQQIGVPHRKEEYIVPNVQCFCLETTDDLISDADIQINLAGLLNSLFGTDSSVKGTGAYEFISHDAVTFPALIAKASAVLTKMEELIKGQRYYSLDLPDNITPAKDLQPDITEKLKKEGIELSASAGLPSNRNDADEADKKGDRPSGLAAFWNDLWAVFSKEQKRFHELFGKLMNRYDPEALKEDQKRVFDCCSDVYMEWKSDNSNEIRYRPPQLTEEKRPKLEQEADKELEKTRELCAEGILEKLDEYEDVREEALDILQQSKEIERCWSPEHMQQENNRFFRRFTAIMGLVFVAVMMIPYILVDSRKMGMPAVKLTFWALSFVLMVVLYCLGLFIWSRKRTKKLSELTYKLNDLSERSTKAREESIARAVEVYGKLLPKFVKDRQLREVQKRIDKANASIERKTSLHKSYITDAKKELNDMCTALRIRMPNTRGIDTNDVCLDCTLPPYDQKNQKAYLFFMEGGDDK